VSTTRGPRKRRRSPGKSGNPIGTVRPDLPVLPRVDRWIALVVVVATVLAYVPALRAPFVVDDNWAIEAAGHWQAAEGMPTAGRPVVLATLAGNYAMNRALGVDQRPDPYGPNKGVSYRLFNLLIHLSAGALLFAVLRRGMRERAIPDDWRAIADPVAGIVTALWLLHPIQSEVINYIVQRTEAQASLCYLVVLYASQRAWDAALWSRVRWYVVAVIACVLGMLSKEIVITVPLAVMLYDRAFRLPSWSALWRPGSGRGYLYVALWVSCLAPVALAALAGRGEPPDLHLLLPWYAYFYTQCWAIAHYLRLVVWPNALSADYGFRAIHGTRGIPGLVLLSALGAATLAAWTRVQRSGWFAFLGSMFFMLLAPSSSFVPVPLEIAAERRIYLALAPVLVVAVVGAEWIRRRVATSVSPRWVGAGVAGIAAALTVTTAMRSRTYTSPEALWRSATQAVPENSRALGFLGVALFNSRPPKIAAAESAFVRAFTEDSSCQGGCREYATLLSAEGRFREAVPLLERQAAQYGPRALNDVRLNQQLALDWMKLNDYDRAIPYLERLVQLDPKVSHFVMLGVAYLSDGRRDEAVTTFRHITALEPDNAQVQELSARLQDGTRFPEALPNLKDFALHMAGELDAAPYHVAVDSLSRVQAR
jgi:tetratricopeptide (TPR) repeat protein